MSMELMQMVVKYNRYHFDGKKVFSDLVYSSGNVGIDTMSPQFDLDVASTMRSKELAVYDEAIVQSINVDLNSKASVPKRYCVNFR